MSIGRRRLEHLPVLLLQREAFRGHLDIAVSVFDCFCLQTGPQILFAFALDELPHRAADKPAAVRGYPVEDSYGLVGQNDGDAVGPTSILITLHTNRVYFIPIALRRVNRGEIYLVELDPARGHEIQKTRTALIIQNDVSNRYSPITIVAAHQLAFQNPAALTRGSRRARREHGLNKALGRHS